MDEALNDNNGWDEAYRHIFTYNDSTMLLESENVEYFYQDTWLKSSLKTYTYDENYHLIDYIYNSSSGGTYYDYREKISSAYDENGHLHQKFGYKWDGFQWIQYDRVLNFTYKGELFTAYGYELRVSYEEATAVNEKNTSLQKFELAQNYPNPFNPSTRISYNLPQSETVTLKVYDMRGREIATLVNAKQSAGKHTVEFNADQYKLSSGVYVYSINAGSFFDVKKLIMVK